MLRLFQFCLTCVAVVHAVGAGEPRVVSSDERPIDLDILPLLFADDAGIAAQRGVVRTLHPARTGAQPVLQADRPW